MSLTYRMSAPTADKSGVAMTGRGTDTENVDQQHSCRPHPTKNLNMCFSATASFTAGTALSAVGGLTLRKSRGKAELPLALVPLMFGIQQLSEGVLWVSLRNDLVLLQTWATLISEGMTLNRVRDGKPGGDGTCRGCHGVAHRHAGEGVACAFVGLLGASSVQEEPADKDQSAGSTGLGYQDSSEATVVGQSPAGVVRPPGFGPWAHPSTARAHALRSSPTASRASHAPAPPLRAMRS